MFLPLSISQQFRSGYLLSFLHNFSCQANRELQMHLRRLEQYWHFQFMLIVFPPFLLCMCEFWFFVLVFFVTHIKLRGAIHYKTFLKRHTSKPRVGSTELRKSRRAALPEKMGRCRKKNVSDWDENERDVREIQCLTTSHPCMICAHKQPFCPGVQHRVKV